MYSLKYSTMELANDNTLIQEFDLYLQKIKGIGKKARGNYLSWTRFLMKNHDLSKIRTEDDVKKILEMEEMMMSSDKRTVYRKKSDLVNFGSTLNNFLHFICSYRQTQEMKRQMLSIDQIIELVGQTNTLAEAEKMTDTLLFIGYQIDYTFSEEQKSRLKGHLARMGSRIYVDKLMMPGSTFNSSK